MRFVTLVSQAYTSISLADFAKYVGLSELEAGKLAAEQPGWTYDTENRVIRPVKAEVKETETIPSEQQLHLLTDFVAFLEKWNGKKCTHSVKKKIRISRIQNLQTTSQPL